MASRKRKSSGPQRIEVPVGPFVGMRDQPDPTASEQVYAASLTNVYTEYGEWGTAQIARPGFRRSSSTQMGSGGARTAQGIYCHTMLNGTSYNFTVVGGKVYRIAVLDALGTDTDVTPVGPTISTTNRVYFASLGDNLIVSDGVNKPWVASNLSGTPITGTVITAASGAWYGPPVVYYAKLFGILASERTTIEWSEENDPTTGYAANNFNNQWTLGQTGGEPLTCLHATNSALYYFRPSSIGAVSGAVNDEFSTTGVHDAVDTTVGTTAPGAVFRTPGGIFFLDVNGFPHVFTPGAGVSDWPKRATEATLRNRRADYVPLAAGCYSPDTGMALIAHPYNFGENHWILAFDPIRQTAQGTWELAATYFGVVGTIKDTQGRDAVAGIDQNGYWYTQHFEVDNYWHDYLDGSTASTVTHAVETGAIASDPATEVAFTRGDLTLRGSASGTMSISVDYRIPRANYGTARTVTVPAAAVTNDAVHAAVGLNARGRWIKFRVRHTTVEEFQRFGFIEGRLTGAVVGTPAGVK
jgi:hypothetical protein